MFTEIVIVAALIGVFYLSKYALDRSGRVEINFPFKISFIIESPLPWKTLFAHGDRHVHAGMLVGKFGHTQRNPSPSYIMQKPKSNLLIVLQMLGVVFLLSLLWGLFLGLLGGSNSSQTPKPIAETETPQGAPAEPDTGEPIHNYETYLKATDPTSLLMKRCTKEVGLPDNEPQYKVTPQEIRDLMACMSRATLKR